MKPRLLLLAIYVLVFMQGCAPTQMEESEMKSQIYTIADFIEVEIGMPYVDVLKLIEPDSTPQLLRISNYRRLTYELTDGSQMKLSFWSDDTLMTMKIIDSTGREFVLKYNE